MASDRGWGGVAQRAAARLVEGRLSGSWRPPAPTREGQRPADGEGARPPAARQADRTAARETDRPATGRLSAPPLPRPAGSGDGSGRPSSRSARPSRRRTEGTPLDIDRDELERAGGPGQGERLERKLREAARAYEDERLDDALRRLRRLISEAPGYAPARELYGLAAYRQGRWADALRELEVFAQLTGSTEQHPVMADSCRALRRWDEVDRLWAELREASPSAELVTEGRIVAAGALADRGELSSAIELLARSFDPPQRPKPFHLRRMYALADLYDRVGDVPRARELFRRVAAADPDFFDVTDRVRNLG